MVLFNNQGFIYLDINEVLCASKCLFKKRNRTEIYLKFLRNSGFVCIECICILCYQTELELFFYFKKQQNIIYKIYNLQ